MVRYFSVAFNAVKTDGSYQVRSIPNAVEVVHASLPGRYTLALALRIVRRMETSASRSAVFNEIKSKNALYRFVDWIYQSCDDRIFKPLLLFAYMLKCVACTGPSCVKGTEEAVAISQFPNEHRTIDRVESLVPQIEVLRISLALRQSFGREQWRATAALILTAGRIFRFLQVLARSYNFMPSARIAGTLAFYIRFSYLFTERPGLEAAIVASNYSPEAVGMAAAAHRKDRRVVYANHAPVPANASFIPPVLADCALVYGEAMSQTYTQSSKCTAEIALIGQPGASEPMKFKEEVKTVGIFLTAGTRVEVLQSLIASVLLGLPFARIIIRQHPVTLLQSDFAEIGLDDLNVEVTIGEPLEAQIATCDIVICGNSGVALNVVSGGRPVAYLSSLDDGKFDTLGFVQSRLIYSMPWWTDDLYSRLKHFYQTSGWQDTMCRYDAAYLVDRDALNMSAREVLMRHLKPSSSSTEAQAPKVSKVLVSA